MRKDNGFLLIEVMVAVALLAVGLVYVSRAFNNCLNTMSQVFSYTLSSHLAEEKLFEVEMDADTQAKTQTKGTFSEYPDLNFEFAMDELKDLQLKEIGITVRWVHGRRKGNFELKSYLPDAQ